MRKMTLARWWTVPAAVALLAACQPAAQEEAADEAAVSAASEPVDVQAEAARIMELEREWLARFHARDIEGVLDLHAEGARLMAPGAPAAETPAAIAEMWRGLADTEGLVLAWEPTSVRVAPSGDMAYDVGTYTMTLPDGTEDRGKYSVVWVKEDGRWKVAVDMFNSDLAPEDS